jgi:hypothetical protein
MIPLFLLWRKYWGNTLTTGNGKVKILLGVDFSREMSVVHPVFSCNMLFERIMVEWTEVFDTLVGCMSLP